MREIRPDQLQNEMQKLLKEYGDDVYEIVESTARKMARAAASKLKRISPGEYASGWTHKAKKKGKVEYVETVYNRTKPGLTHLLEKPHKTNGKGHYPKHPGSNKDHTGLIAEVEEEYTELYVKELMKEL